MPTRVDGYPSSQKERKAERNAEIWRLHCSGVTVRDLARRFEVSPGRIQYIIDRTRAKYPVRDRAELTRELAAQLDYCRSKAQEILDADRAVAMRGEHPVPVVNPDGTLSGRYAVDHGPALSAIGAIVQVQARESRLLGLDKPEVVAVDGPITYIVEGVDMEKLR